MNNFELFTLIKVMNGGGGGGGTTDHRQLSYRSSANQHPIAAIAGLEDALDSIQEEIDAITAATDVVDVVATYADLEDYDTDALHNNDIIKVLLDSTHGDAIAYYRWVITVDPDTEEESGAWSYIGSQGPFYTKAEVDILLAAKQAVIADLEDIREGAGAGSTALQSSDLNGYATENYVDNAIGAYHDSQKLDAAHISHETWTFTLEDDTTVTKEVALWIS